MTKEIFWKKILCFKMGGLALGICDGKRNSSTKSFGINWKVAGSVMFNLRFPVYDSSCSAH